MSEDILLTYVPIVLLPILIVLAGRKARKINEEMDEKNLPIFTKFYLSVRNTPTLKQGFQAKIHQKGEENGRRNYLDYYTDFVLNNRDIHNRKPSVYLPRESKRNKNSNEQEKLYRRCS